MGNISEAPMTMPFNMPAEAQAILSACPRFHVAESVQDLLTMAAPASPDGWAEVAYTLPDGQRVTEARVCLVRNGLSANYLEPYMRRRDPDCMVIADDLPTNKPTYRERFGQDFDSVREETFAWLKSQELAVFAFHAGKERKGADAIAIAPANAAFFALGLALLQGILRKDEVDEAFDPKAVIYVAPPFRHTHYAGKQVVVHNRRPGLHEVFSYNLYPGPSAKKGIYGVLLNVGESEKWVTMHCSTVQVVTPYGNKFVIAHEGASGGGKSEMLEHIHRERDGSLILGENLITGERRELTLPRNCDLRPVTDDMALCHPSLDKGRGKLSLVDAESAWFVRVNHIEHYGVDPYLEDLCVHPPHPLLFLNIDARPGATALIWEHTEDEPGKPCPNPRVILPREIVPNVVTGAVDVDVRSFGVRTPPCSKAQPTYGIVGLFQILPPALAWLWRLTAPRGHANPSIVGTEGMSSEGVGSYWPFATGRRVDQANLLLQQILDTPKVRYVLTPNQHIGAWKVGFMPQWIAREYLARRGNAIFHREEVEPARCPLLGWSLKTLMIEGRPVSAWFLDPSKQPELGLEAYDAGSRQLQEFFEHELKKYLEADLLPLGRQIIETCLGGGTVADYAALLGPSGLEEED